MGFLASEKFPAEIPVRVEGFWEFPFPTLIGSATSGGCLEPEKPIPGLSITIQ